MEDELLNNANPRPLPSGSIPVMELVKEALTWPLYMPFYVTSGNVGYTVAGVAGVGVAYYYFGSPIGLDYMTLAEQYVLAGVVQTGVGYLVSKDLQGLM